MYILRNSADKAVHDTIELSMQLKKKKKNVSISIKFYFNLCSEDLGLLFLQPQQ